MDTSRLPNKGTSEHLPCLSSQLISHHLWPNFIVCCFLRTGESLHLQSIAIKAQIPRYHVDVADRKAPARSAILLTTFFACHTGVSITATPTPCYTTQNALSCHYLPRYSGAVDLNPHSPDSQCARAIRAWAISAFNRHGGYIFI